MAQNCSADVQRVIAHIDDVGRHGDPAAIQELKDLFGLGDLEHFDDFARFARLHLLTFFGHQALTTHPPQCAPERPLAVAVEQLLHWILGFLPILRLRRGMAPWLWPRVFSLVCARPANASRRMWSLELLSPLDLTVSAWKRRFRAMPTGSRTCISLAVRGGFTEM